jgi:hypothetical protein
MSERMAQLLKSLRDVQGVVGSFVWAKSGALLARDLPEAVLDDGALEEVGQRIARIYEAFAGTGDELDTATLVFADRKLHLREVDSAFIAVLSEPRVNEPALKMALLVIGRGIYEQLERDAGRAAATSEPEPTPLRTSDAAAHALRLRLQRTKRDSD